MGTGLGLHIVGYSWVGWSAQSVRPVKLWTMFLLVSTMTVYSLSGKTDLSKSSLLRIEL